MKKLILTIITLFLIIANIFGEVEEEPKIAENIPGRFTFTSHRTSDGKLYAFLLENGRIENLGIETDFMKISPNGNLGAAFITGNDLVIYDFEKKEIIKEYKVKYEQTVALDWEKDEKYIYYDGKEEINKEKDIYNTHFMRINLKNGKEEIIKSYKNVGHWYNLKNLNVSPNNKRIVYTIGISGEYEDEAKMVKICVMNVNGKKEKLVWRVGTPLGWYPDNKNILIHTNMYEDGSMINNTKGRLYKINVDTLEKEIIEETVQAHYTMEKLSKDGKYMYSVRYFPPLMTWNLVIGDTGDRENEIMLTYPVPFVFNGMIRYSEDSSPDWWY
jgi:hypothetical protein